MRNKEGKKQYAGHLTMWMMPDAIEIEFQPPHDSVR
jgi:hypothetical protein